MSKLKIWNSQYNLHDYVKCKPIPEQCILSCSYCANTSWCSTRPHQENHHLITMPAWNKVCTFCGCPLLGSHHASGSEGIPGPLNRNQEDGLPDYRKHVFPYWSKGMGYSIKERWDGSADFDSTQPSAEFNTLVSPSAVFLLHFLPGATKNVQFGTWELPGANIHKSPIERLCLALGDDH